MKETDFGSKLNRSIPEMPASFAQAMEKTLGDIRQREQAELACVPAKQKNRASGLRRRTLVYVLAALLLLAATAAAAIHWNFFDAMFGKTPQNADQVMQQVLHKETINNVEITVSEAGYDGKTLYLMWSFRMLDVDTPLGMYRDGETGEGISEDDLKLLREHGVGWWIDQLWIDGKCVDMPNNSGGYESGSPTPGELIECWYYRLDNEELYLPDGELEVSLPIGECQPLDDYRRSEHPEKYGEDGNLLLPEKGMVTFKLTTNMRKKVKTEQPRVWLELPEVRACVKEVTYTPLMMYVTLEMEGNQAALDKYIAENGPGYLDENGNLMWAYSGMDVYGEWASGLRLVDGAGQEVFPDTDEMNGYICGNNGYGDQWAEYLLPYSDHYPDEMYLAPWDDAAQKADMTRAVKVK